MKFKPADVLKALVTIENGFNRMKKVYPNAIPMFQVFSSTDSEFISVFVCEVTDFYPDEGIVKFDTVSDKSKLMKLDKMKVPNSCPNFIEAFLFLSSNRGNYLKRYQRKIKNSVDFSGTFS